MIYLLAVVAYYVRSNEIAHALYNMYKYYTHARYSASSGDKSITTRERNVAAAAAAAADSV